MCLKYRCMSRIGCWMTRMGGGCVESRGGCLRMKSRAGLTFIQIYDVIEELTSPRHVPTMTLTMRALITSSGRLDRRNSSRIMALQGLTAIKMAAGHRERDKIHGVQSQWTSARIEPVWTLLIVRECTVECKWRGFKRTNCAPNLNPIDVKTYFFRFFSSKTPCFVLFFSDSIELSRFCFVLTLLTSCRWVIKFFCF